MGLKGMVTRTCVPEIDYPHIMAATVDVNSSGGVGINVPRAKLTKSLPRCFR